MRRTSGKKNLTDNDKRAIVVGRQNGLTMMTLAGMFGVTEACISQFLKRRKAQDGSTKSQRTGRPRVNVQNQSKTHRPCDQTGSFLEFAISAIRLDRETTSAAGIMRRRPVKKPLFPGKNRAARVKWTKEHLNWTRQGWNKILWSDETVLHHVSQPNWSTNPLNSITPEEEELVFVGPQNLVPALTGPVEMLLRPLHPGGSILFRNKRRRFTVETDGGDGEFKKTYCLIAGAVSLGLVLDAFKMFLSPLRSLTRGFPELRNGRLCHAEHSYQSHHGQSILTTHNDGSFVDQLQKVLIPLPTSPRVAFASGIYPILSVYRLKTNKRCQTSSFGPDSTLPSRCSLSFRTLLSFATLPRELKMYQDELTAAEIITPPMFENERLLDEMEEHEKYCRLGETPALFFNQEEKEAYLRDFWPKSEEEDEPELLKLTEEDRSPKPKGDSPSEEHLFEDDEEISKEMDLPPISPMPLTPLPTFDFVPIFFPERYPIEFTPTLSTLVPLTTDLLVGMKRLGIPQSEAPNVISQFFLDHGLVPDLISQINST
ncbi:unnamed protein product [Caenorhabditis auriculariae]|uniref:Uncharacterized protein n=1 Tax=Caenorhabditis auriculariae TaxID=2777116 RepID=A0A8S1HVP8_9PELO|nr:unnamed protein product [Caenorhabditis auriculariae]